MKVVLIDRFEASGNLYSDALKGLGLKVTLVAREGLIGGRDFHEFDLIVVNLWQGLAGVVRELALNGSRGKIVVLIHETIVQEPVLTALAGKVRVVRIGPSSLQATGKLVKAVKAKLGIKRRPGS